MTTKEEIIGKIQMVTKALDTVSVHGKANLTTLAGSIGVLEDLMKQISVCEIQIKDEGA